MAKFEINPKTKCGYIAIIGAPNVGKSTLINRLVGVKISIVSRKVQTTRNRILGICIDGNTQLVFIDTPGIFQPQRRLERAMVAAAWAGVRGADHVALMVDAERGVNTNKSILLKLPKTLKDSKLFDKTFMISAKNGDGCESILTDFSQKLPNGPWVFPKEQISDMTDRLFAAEITREKIFHQLYDELPYATTVETENWEILEDSTIRIKQVVYVKRDSQKAIMLGKNGNRIKSIGIEARTELEDIFGYPVQLMLFVKVRENWTDDPNRYKDWSLDFNA